MPKISDLIRLGAALYEERLKPVLVLLLIQIAAGVSFGAAIVVSALSTPVLGVSGMALVVLGVLALIYATFWLEVAFLRAFSDREEFVTVRGLLARSRPQAFPFMWVSFLVSLAVLGVIVLIVALGFGGVLLFGKSIATAETVLGVFVALIATVFLMTRLVFANWIVVLDRARGFAALGESMRLTRGLFWPVFRRVFGLSLIMGGLTFVLQAFSVLLLGRYGSIVAQLMSIFVLTPIYTAATLFLYRSVAIEVPSAAHP